MRTTVKLYTALTLAAALACQGSYSENQADLARAESLRSEMANANLNNGGSNAVVSALEVPPQAELSRARQGTPDKSASALGGAASNGTRAVANVARGGSNNAALNSRDDSLAINTRVGVIRLNAATLAIAKPKATTSNTPAPAAVPTPRSLPSDPVATGTLEGDEVGKPADGTPADTRVPPMEPPAAPPTTDRERPRPQPSPPIVIRGGPTRPVLDPCAKHIPQGGTVGGGHISVNNRIPIRVGGGVVTGSAARGGIRIRG